MGSRRLKRSVLRTQLDELCRATGASKHYLRSTTPNGLRLEDYFQQWAYSRNCDVSVGAAIDVPDKLATDGHEVG